MLGEGLISNMLTSTAWLRPRLRVPTLSASSLRIPTLIRPVQPRHAYGLVEAVLITLLALQGARLVWTSLSSVAPIGEWRGEGLRVPTGSLALLTRFDPFFRFAVAPVAGAAVTSLPLKLTGIRLDLARGRGSAIIGTPDGIENSYAVGETIMAGVTLKSVAFDNVTIDRGGTAEQLFLDQSRAAPVAGGAGAGVVATPGTVSLGALRSGIAFVPRIVNGTPNGLTVSPQGSGEAFRAIGLQSGDVVTLLNGSAIRSPQDVADALSRLTAGTTTTLTVERGGQSVTLSTAVTP